jgi:hypothetical protein
MKRLAALLATLTASCGGTVYAETAYKEVTCVSIAQAQSIVSSFNAKPVFTFATSGGFVLIAEANEDVIVLEFRPADNMACLVLDGKKFKGA